MIVSIHQPNYLPHLGFFDKMRKSDIFVIYDDAQFNKEDFQHRNRIRIFHGWKWLTIPVDKKPLPINSIRIKNEITIKYLKWNDAHLKDIQDNYKKSTNFSAYENELVKIYKVEYDMLIDLNMALIHFLKRAFKVNTKLIFSSEFCFTSKSTERLVEIVEAVGGDVYLSGNSGRDYLNFSLFNKKGIKLEFQDYEHPVYDQMYNEFIPNMSSIDALFNVGKLLV